MQITISVPEMKCAKCDATAPIQPRLLFLKAQTAQFKDVISSVRQEASGVVAIDDTQRTWETLVDDLPLGWVAGPGPAKLCDKCAVLWLEAQKVFLTPPPPPPEPEAKPVSANATKTAGTTKANAKPVPGKILPSRAPTTSGAVVDPSLPL